jgi:REP element-mobilizing transposase RayT
MVENQGTPQRKRIRLDHDVYGMEGTVFHITVSTADRRTLFSNAAFARAVFDNLLHGPVSQEAELFAVCVMPDHVHMLLGAKETNLVDLVARWKTFTTNLAHRMGFRGDVWQRSFYDHAMRLEEDLITTAEYLVANPVRAGLVEDVAHYPYLWHKWLDLQET